MRILKLLTLLLAATVCSFAFADTLELADGSVLEGDFVGSSNGIIMFNTGESIEAFPEKEVVGIFISEGVATAQELAAGSNAPGISAPAGTRLVLRMVDTVDSKKHKTGHKFRAQLESALVVDGVTLAPRGAMVYGTVVASQQSARAVGKSALAMEFTDIMIDERLYPIATQGLAAQSGGEGGRTLGRTARAAALGGLVDGSSGAKTGAKVGAGVSILTGGESIFVPSGTLLETSLRMPLNIS